MLVFIYRRDMVCCRYAIVNTLDAGDKTDILLLLPPPPPLLYGILVREMLSGNSRSGDKGHGLLPTPVNSFQYLQTAKKRPRYL